MQFRVKNEYIDRTLDRRVYVGEKLELSVDRANEIKMLGIGLEPIRGEPKLETAIAVPKAERAVNNRAKRT